MAEINERASCSSEPTTPAPPKTPIVGPNAELTILAKDMFSKIGTYLHGQLEGTVDEYKLLEEMNKAAAQRYIDMKSVTMNIADRLTSLNDKYVSLRPYLDQIDEMDANSRRLEEAAYQLDAYVKNLELRFKTMEQRPGGGT